MGNSISCLVRRCFSVPPINTAPIHVTTPAGASDTVYAYLTGLLLALIEIKYEGSSSNLFNEHPVLVMLFLISKLVHVIAFLVPFPSEHQTGNDGDTHESLDLKVVVRHVSGIIACELLLLLLVTPINCFIINASALMLILLMFLCCKYLLKLFNRVLKQGPEIHDAEEPSHHVETGN